jgi:hypothetical protein
MGRTPRIGNTSDVTATPDTRSGSSPATMFASTGWYAPIASNDWLIAFQSR